MVGKYKKDVTVGYVPNDWRIMSNKHSTSYDLKMTNPNYHNGIEYQHNCQRCVPTYEMRRRGYDVEVLPATLGNNNKIHRWDIMRDKWDKVFENAKFESCKNDLEDVKKYMKACGNGARAEVKVIWQNGLDGHVFVAEQIKGKTLFFDPQTGEKMVEYYFTRIQKGSTMICRIDNLTPTKLIEECCKGR